MTMPDERTRALSQTRSFLEQLSDSLATPGVPEAMRGVARQLLRHYPEARTVDLTAAVLPQWWAAEGPARGSAFCYLELLGLATELAGAQDVAALIAARRKQLMLRLDDGPDMPFDVYVC